MNKSFIKNFIAVLLVFLLTAFVVVRIQWYCIDKESYTHTSRLTRGTLPVDVLFIGDSQVECNIIPAQLYRDFGISSQLIFMRNNDIERFKYALDMALEYCDPKLVVLSTDQYWVRSGDDTLKASFHNFSDSLPLTSTKAKAVTSYFRNCETATEMLFPFLLYHNRIFELTEEDFYPHYSPTQGSELSGKVTPVQLPPPLEESIKKMPEEGELAFGFIGDFVEHCNQMGLPVLLTTFPFEANEEYQSYFHQLNDITDKFGINYVNFTDIEGVVNPQGDFKDGVHLNASGASRLSHYLGEYISSGYDIPDRRKDPAYSAAWNDAYLEYSKARRDILEKEKDNLFNVLTHIKEPEFDFVVYIDEFSKLLYSPFFSQVLENTAHIPKWNRARDMQENYLLCKSGAAVDEYVGGMDQTINIGQKALLFTGKENGGPSLVTDFREYNDTRDLENDHINDQENNPSKDGDGDYFDFDGYHDVYVTVFDHYTGELILSGGYQAEEQLITHINQE